MSKSYKMLSVTIISDFFVAKYLQ